MGTTECDCFGMLKYSLCTSNKSQQPLMLFNGNRFRHTASSVKSEDMDRQESPQLIERKTQVDADAQETVELPIFVSGCVTFYQINVSSQQRCFFHY